MISRKMQIQLSTGLEARPVAMLVQVASQYQSRIFIESENKQINAKSIMGMMGLGLVSGDEIQVCADGTDESKALDGIQAYLSQKK